MKFRILSALVLMGVTLCVTTAFAGSYKQMVAQKISVAERTYNAQRNAAEKKDNGMGTTDYYIEMSDISNEFSAFLDKENNIVYKKLMSVLPQNKKTALRNEERKWIKQRERKCDDLFNNGGMEGRKEAGEYYCQTTKKRVLYLADYYDKVTGGKIK